MTVKFRMDYLKAICSRYRKASKALKSAILDEFCKVCGYNRKYAIRKLALPPEPKPSCTRHRKKTYNSQLFSIVEAIWEAANYPWSARLKEILRLWLPWAKKRYPISAEMEKKFLAISPSTLDRRLKAKKSKIKKRIYGRTKPGTLLKQHIPIKTDHWDVHSPGFTELDLVSHSGPSAAGDFLYSLNLTDIYSGWVESRPVMGKGETAVLLALQEIFQDLPFDLRGIDSDNGSEFINYHLLKFCQKNEIQFTRSRPYKKDDNAHIEQKNWTHVRKLLGWDRYDSPQALQAIYELYRNELRCLMNLFQPSVRKLKTQRLGSKLKHFYDKPKTPLDRLIASKKADSMKLAQLTALREQIDPFDLSHTVNHKLEQIWRLAHHRNQPQITTTPSTKSNGLSKQELQFLEAISHTLRPKLQKRQPFDAP